jgi:hypothetical protein
MITRASLLRTGGVSRPERRRRSASQDLVLMIYWRTDWGEIGHGASKDRVSSGRG